MIGRLRCLSAIDIYHHISGTRDTRERVDAETIAGGRYGVVLYEKSIFFFFF